MWSIEMKSFIYFVIDRGLRVLEILNEQIFYLFRLAAAKLVWRPDCVIELSEISEQAVLTNTT